MLQTISIALIILITIWFGYEITTASNPKCPFCHKRDSEIKDILQDCTIYTCKNCQKDYTIG